MTLFLLIDVEVCLIVNFYSLKLPSQPHDVAVGELRPDGPGYR